VIAYQNDYIDTPTRVYNFTVGNTHNYFAGGLGAWVHNAGSGPDCSLVVLAPGIKNHLTKYDPSRFSRKKGVSGAHNIDEFNKAVSEHNLDIISSNRTSVDGITTIKYRVPKRDRAGNIIPGEFRAEVHTKTVYDPKKISDDDIFKKGTKAANELNQRAPATGSLIDNVVVDGISFRVYIRDGVVTNFHPN